MRDLRQVAEMKVDAPNSVEGLYGSCFGEHIYLGKHSGEHIEPPFRNALCGSGASYSPSTHGDGFQAVAAASHQSPLTLSSH